MSESPAERPAGRSGAVLVIDDDFRIRESLRESLTRRGHEVCVCPDGASGLAKIREDPSFDVILCDLSMPGMDGIEVCRALSQSGCEIPVVMFTAFGTVETAVEAMRLGAFDYLTKPIQADELEVVIEKALRQRRLVRENRFLRGELQEGGVAVGRSPAMEDVYRLIERYARNPSTVLIRGESGTGKEVIARRIHALSSRAAAPFICVNCAALSAGLLESELFGHEKGAFTGAEQRRVGRFELAEGGTLLLDEVSEIDPGLQAKLLRVLQERTFERVGSSRSQRADVRVLATSNRELEEEVRAGRFREDLFFRLNVLPIRLPPLRERPSDIPLLARHFLDRLQARSGGLERRLSGEAERRLVEYRWPGNVRELENIIERACLLSDRPVLEAADLAGLGGERPIRSPHEAEEETGGPSSEVFQGRPLREVERLLIEDSLRRHGGHQQRTASELGIGVRTLRTKIKKWGLGGRSRGVPAGVPVGDTDEHEEERS